jgi:hypothetical protein
LKTLFTILACLIAASVAYAAPDIVDIKIEWLNAKDCGIDGCKPKRIIMRQGTTMEFGWGPGAELEKRGVFALFPSIHGEALKLKITRTQGSTDVAEDEKEFRMGMAHDMVLKDVALRVTITEWQEPNAKN